MKLTFKLPVLWFWIGLILFLLSLFLIYAWIENKKNGLQIEKFEEKKINEFKDELKDGLVVKNWHILILWTTVSFFFSSSRFILLWKLKVVRIWRKTKMAINQQSLIEVASGSSSSSVIGPDQIFDKWSNRRYWKTTFESRQSQIREPQIENPKKLGCSAD